MATVPQCHRPLKIPGLVCPLYAPLLFVRNISIQIKTFTSCWNLINTRSPSECPYDVSLFFFLFFSWDSNVVLALSFQKWTNLLLTWEPKHYGGIKRVRIDPKLLWIPDIVLYNRSVRKFNDQILSGSNVFIWLVCLINFLSQLRTWLKRLKTISSARCSINGLRHVSTFRKSHLITKVLPPLFEKRHTRPFFFTSKQLLLSWKLSHISW